MKVAAIEGALNMRRQTLETWDLIAGNRTASSIRRGGRPEAPHTVFLTVRELGEKLKISQGAIRKIIAQREGMMDDRQETRNPKRGEARYRYRLSAFLDRS
jgi:hypothetical protein